LQEKIGSKADCLGENDLMQKLREANGLFIGRGWDTCLQRITAHHPPNLNCLLSIICHKHGLWQTELSVQATFFCKAGNMAEHVAN
jgi:hypothetical protein